MNHAQTHQPECLLGPALQREAPDPTQPGHALAPHAHVLKCDGTDIIRKGVHRRGRFLFILPGNFQGKPGTIGKVGGMDTPEPWVLLDTPQGSVKLLGNIVRSDTHWLTLQAAGAKASVVCEDVFESAVVFHSWEWIDQHGDASEVPADFVVPTAPDANELCGGGASTNGEKQPRAKRSPARAAAARASHGSASDEDMANYGEDSDDSEVDAAGSDSDAWVPVSATKQSTPARTPSNRAASSSAAAGSKRRRAAASTRTSYRERSSDESSDSDARSSSCDDAPSGQPRSGRGASRAAAGKTPRMRQPSWSDDDGDSSASAQSVHTNPRASRGRAPAKRTSATKARNDSPVPMDSDSGSAFSVESDSDYE